MLFLSQCKQWTQTQISPRERGSILTSYQEGITNKASETAQALSR